MACNSRKLSRKPSSDCAVALVASTVAPRKWRAVEGLLDNLRLLQAIHSWGRPKWQRAQGQLVELLQSHFSVVDIAKLFGCSPKTVYRRIHEFGMMAVLHSSLTDGDLDNIVQTFVLAHPNCGEWMLVGCLQSLGWHISRQRVRKSLLWIDPHGVSLRQRQVLHRRQYSVAGPSSLWQVYGYYKLTWWTIVIHGGIDGFSCEIVYLAAATNNKASTVLNVFLQAVEEYGLPLRVRSDKESENIGISHYILNHPERGPDWRSMITGRSVHNQRI